MTGPIVATEIALAELAYLASQAGGDPQLLNEPMGIMTYFERDEVIALGGAIQEARLEAWDDTDAVARYFAAVGAVIARSTTTFVVRSGPAHGATISLYFVTDGPCVAVDLTDGTSLLSLLDRFPADKVATDSGGPDSVTIVGRFRKNGDRAYAAVWRGHIASSADARHWEAADAADAGTVLHDFVSG